MEFIYDRTQSDLLNNTKKAYINYSDLNRIENNLEEIATLYYKKYFIPYAYATHENWGAWRDQTSGIVHDRDVEESLRWFPTADKLNKRTLSDIRGFITFLQSYYRSYYSSYIAAGGPSLDDIPTSFDKIDYNGMNNIELALYTLYQIANY